MQLPYHLIPAVRGQCFMDGYDGVASCTSTIFGSQCAPGHLTPSFLESETPAYHTPWAFIFIVLK